MKYLYILLIICLLTKDIETATGPYALSYQYKNIDENELHKSNNKINNYENSSGSLNSKIILNENIQLKDYFKPRLKRSLLRQFIRNRDRLIPLSHEIDKTSPLQSSSQDQLQGQKIFSPTPFMESLHRTSSSSRNTFIEESNLKGTFEELINTKLQLFRDTASAFDYISHLRDSMKQSLNRNSVFSANEYSNSGISSFEADNQIDVSSAPSEKNISTQFQKRVLQNMKEDSSTSHFPKRSTTQLPKSSRALASNTTQNTISFPITADKNSPKAEILKSNTNQSSSSTRLDNNQNRKESSQTSAPEQNDRKPSSVNEPPSGFLINVFNSLTKIPVFGSVFQASVDPLYRPIIRSLNPQIIDRSEGDADDNDDKEFFCFGNLGCIKTTRNFFDPLFRPVNLPPLKREEIDTKFYLYTRNDPSGTIITNSDIGALFNTSFNSRKPTKLIIHGYMDSAQVTWMLDMIRGFLIHGDYNVFAVDWSGGSRVLYPQATANIRVVGLEVAYLVNWMVLNMNVSASNVHIVGHSLGAHTSGYAGERISGLGRITGLDPAEPFFQHLPEDVRLDPSDALFVDVIHTDSDSIFAFGAIGGGFGLEQPVGHVDFYPNNGRAQPGCNSLIRVPFSAITEGQNIFEGLDAAQKELVTCNHVRAPKLFTDSLTSSCPYLAFVCPDYDTFSQGECFDCGEDGSNCSPLGIDANVWNSKNRTLTKMFLKTNQGPHYCKYHYRLTIYFGDLAHAGSSLRGKLKVTLITEDGQLREFDLTRENPVVFPRGGSVSFLLENNEDLSGTSEALLSWSYEADVFNPLTFCVLLCKSDLNIAAVKLVGLDTKPVVNWIRKHDAIDIKSNEVLMCQQKGKKLIIKSNETVKISSSEYCDLWMEHIKIAEQGRANQTLPNTVAAQEQIPPLTVLQDVIATIYTP